MRRFDLDNSLGGTCLWGQWHLQFDEAITAAAPPRWGVDGSDGDELGRVALHVERNARDRDSGEPQLDRFEGAELRMSPADAEVLAVGLLMMAAIAEQRWREAADRHEPDDDLLGFATRLGALLDHPATQDIRQQFINRWRWRESVAASSAPASRRDEPLSAHADYERARARRAQVSATDGQLLDALAARLGETSADQQLLQRLTQRLAPDSSDF